jgi:restriction system protein
MSAEPPTADGPFIGRRQELEALRAELLSDLDAATTSGVAVVLGMTGIGKTSLINEFIRRHRDAFPAGICLTTPAFPRDDPDGAVVNQAADLVRSLHPQDDGLVVIDEAHRFDPTQAGALVAELRRQRPRARVIFISSIPLGNRWFEVVLDRLSDSDVVALLTGQLELSDNDIQRLASHMQGNPLLTSVIARLAAHGEGIAKILNRLQPTTFSGLLGPDGVPLRPDTRPAERVAGSFRALNADLIAHIEARPELMRELTPRQFEEFVAALYEKHGFEVELTPASKDMEWCRTRALARAFWQPPPPSRQAEGNSRSGTVID